MPSAPAASSPPGVALLLAPAVSLYATAKASGALSRRPAATLAASV
ncbi:hypothetical protein AB0C76_15035 [Kitasatospora sp. NPDC048722]